MLLQIVYLSFFRAYYTSALVILVIHFITVTRNYR